MIAKPLREWITPRDVAALLGVSENTVGRLGKKGVLGTLKIEGMNGTRYRSADVQALIASGMTPATRGAAAARPVLETAMG